jgi:tRNA pseudouridine38-40 synthase
MGEFAKALSSIGIFATPIASGRTDTGVHALRQPIVFDLPPFWEEQILKQNSSFLLSHLNQKLSPYIRIKRLYKVDDDFNPRFDAVRRSYRYIVTTKPSVFCSDYAAFVPYIDEKAVQDAIGAFEGVHDFGLFKKNGSETENDIRKIYKASFYKKNILYVFNFEANGFLRSQIRLSVGFLLAISEGRYTKEELLEQLDGKKRHFSKPAPPNGLYLSRVAYDKPFLPL